jgi:hypothetical protein
MQSSGASGWQVTSRLIEKGLICNPVGKNKSVVSTDEG